MSTSDIPDSPTRAVLSREEIRSQWMRLSPSLEGSVVRVDELITIFPNRVARVAQKDESYIFYALSGKNQLANVNDKLVGYTCLGCMDSDNVRLGTPIISPKLGDVSSHVLCCARCYTDFRNVV